jgi:hypothetical protein
MDLLLLTHAHSIANAREPRLLKMSHMITGWLRPTLFCLTAPTLLLHREI